MNDKHLIGTPFDYYDEKHSVYFEVADKKSAREILSNIDFVDTIEEERYGFTVHITIQQIPEIVRELESVNIAIYGIERNNFFDRK